MILLISNHPPQILRALRKNIGRRLSSISSSQEVFQSSIKDYQNVFRNNGFKEKLCFKLEKPNTLVFI